MSQINPIQAPVHAVSVHHIEEIKSIDEPLNIDSIITSESNFVYIPDISNRSLVIGIAGGSGSGKTTLAKAIYDALGSDNITYIAHDSYYKDISHLTMEEREKQNFDHPNALDTDLLSLHISLLKSNQGANIPTYDFTTHSRLPDTELILPRSIILIEGILIFTDKRLYDQIDIKIFVDTDDDIRLIRRIQRDTIERGRSLDKIITQYMKTVRPMYIEYVKPSRRIADIIVPYGFNSVALDLLLSKLRSFLNEK